MHILSQVTDNFPSWVSGRERMTVEKISWSISTKECCRARASNSHPPDHQSSAHSTELPSAQALSDRSSCICNKEKRNIHSSVTPTTPPYQNKCVFSASNHGYYKQQILLDCVCFPLFTTACLTPARDHIWGKPSLWVVRWGISGAALYPPTWLALLEISKMILKGHRTKIP